MNFKLIPLGILCFVIISCDNTPKVISSNNPNEGVNRTTGIFSDSPSSNTGKQELENALSSDSQNIHTVEVIEKLPTSKYIYLLVKENNQEFWIATRKQDINVGESYTYKNGLLKTNFESKEYNRIFEKLYLVSNIIPVAHKQQSSISDNSLKELENKPSLEEVEDIKIEGSIRIAEIVANPNKYKNKAVQISGKCVKVNPNIMGRNWIHINDGSNDDYDFVITSDVNVPEGHVITMTGTVSLDKDFGAGYRYAIIVENGKLVRK